MTTSEKRKRRVVLQRRVKRPRSTPSDRGLLVLTRDYEPLFPKLPERTRLFCLFAAHRTWADYFLAQPTTLGVSDSYGIELVHPVGCGNCVCAHRDCSQHPQGGSFALPISPPGTVSAPSTRMIFFLVHLIVSFLLDLISVTRRFDRDKDTGLC